VQELRCAGCLPDFSRDTLALHHAQIGNGGGCSHPDAQVGHKFISSFPFSVSFNTIYPGVFWCTLVVPAFPNYFFIFSS